jgi:hypothetical protein
MATPDDTPKNNVDLQIYLERAQQSPCADRRNELYLIDGRYVLWIREGDCPDNSYATFLYDGYVDKLICSVYDSIAGPMRSCTDTTLSVLFEEVFWGVPAYLPGHTIEKVY